MTAERVNCWEYMQCGREPGGDCARDNGVCPAAVSEKFHGINHGTKGGRICWLVAGTFCDGVIQGTYADKKDSCRECGFYKKVQLEEAVTEISSRRVEIFATTNIGLVRKANEDRYLIRELDGDTLLFSVADGLGGHKGGAHAAEIVRGKLANMPSVPHGREKEVLARLAVEADAVITRLADEMPELEGMGTTLLCVLLRNNTAYWVHVGDSRFSILRDEQLIQVTKDQNLARFLVEEGEISEEEVPDHYSKDVLDQALGSAMEKPETGQVEVRPGDLLLLSTDGLHSQVSEEIITYALNIDSDLGTRGNLLVRSALDAGGSDNITLVAVRLPID